MHDVDEKDLENVSGGFGDNKFEGYVTYYYMKPGIVKIFSYTHKTNTNVRKLLEINWKFLNKKKNYILIDLEITTEGVESPDDDFID